MVMIIVKSSARSYMTKPESMLSSTAAILLSMAIKRLVKEIMRGCMPSPVNKGKMIILPPRPMMLQKTPTTKRPMLNKIIFPRL